MRHQRQVAVHHVLVADVVAHLTNRFEEGQPLDVADRAADFDDADVGAGGLRDALDVRFDLVGDVRNHLDGRAEIIAAPLLFDHRVIDLARRNVVRALQVLVDEALVVPEIEIGLGPILGHEDLAVLVRVHRTGIDVDIGVELLNGDAETARLEEPSEGGGRDAFAKRTHDTAGEEYVLRHLGKSLFYGYRVAPSAGLLLALLGLVAFVFLVRIGLFFTGLIHATVDMMGEMTRG